MNPPETNAGVPVVVLCAGGTGLLMAESIERSQGLRFAGFLDDDGEKQAGGYSGYPVLGPLDSWNRLPADVRFLSSLYGPKKNAQFFERIRSLGIPEPRWATVIDPHAIVSPKATLAAGCYVGPGAVLEPMARLGRFCAIYGNVYLAHHAELGDYVLCANSVAVAGGVSIGSAAYVGVNAAIREYIRVGSGAVIGMGSVVVKDVPDAVTVAGNPARALRR